MFAGAVAKGAAGLGGDRLAGDGVGDGSGFAKGYGKAAKFF